MLRIFVTTSALLIAIVAHCQASCPVASFNQTSWSLPVGGIDTFTNTSTGATSYQWYVNGILVATTQNFTDTFNTAGDYNVYLVASNGVCADTTSLFNFVHAGRACPVSFSYTPAFPTTCSPVTFTPDTACTYSSYLWFFCQQATLPVPTDTNYSTAGYGSYDPNGIFLYCDQDKNYHVFFGDYDNTADNTRFYRMDFGNSMNNTPVVNELNISGISDIRNHSVSVLYDNGNYYAFFLTNTHLYRAKIGPQISNTNLTVTDLISISPAIGWGHKLLIEKQENNYWALIASRDGWITVGDIGSDIENNNITYQNYNGGTALPYWGMDYINEYGNNYVFAVDFTTGLSRFDFGSSLGNTPVVTSLGQLGTGLNVDLALYENCDSSLDGVYLQETGNNNLLIHFNSITAAPAITGPLNTDLSSSAGVSPYILTDLGVTTFSVEYATDNVARISHGGCGTSDAFSTAEFPPPVWFNEPGEYYVRLVVDEGLPTQSSSCQMVTVDSVNGHPLNLGPDTNLCSSPSIVLHAGPWFQHYIWSNGSTDSTLSVHSTGTYWVTVTNFCGDTLTDSIKVSTSASPAINIGPDTSICGSTSIVLHAGPWYQQYLWSNGSTDSTITVTTRGTYYVTVTDFCNNTRTDSVVVSSDSAVIHFPTADTTICSYDSVYICAPGGYTNYSWNNGLNTQCFYTNLAGNYYVTAIDAGGCTAISNHFNLGVYPVPPIAITVTADTLYCNSGISRQWYFNGQVIDGATSNMLIARNPGNYSVEATDSSGCIAVSNVVEIETSVSQLVNSPYIMIYPNPLEKGNWTLEVDASMVGNVAEIFDDNGRLVYQKTITAPKSELDFKGIGGVYVLRIAANNTYYISKLIKL